MKFKSDIEVQAGLKDSSGSNGSSGQVLSSNGGTVSWVNAGGGTASDVQNQVKAGVAINKGQAVYVTSADGTNIIVGLASNTTEATSSKTLGLLNATVAINGFADVVQIGKLEGLDTSTATVGDPVWLGTNGNLIYGLANKPYAPAHLVYIGVVTRVNANNGEIFVTVQNGFELKEIHDVDITTTPPSGGDVLGFEGAPVNLWVNKTIPGWLGYTPVPTTRTLTINGSTQDLSANRTFTIDTGVTSFNTRTGAVTLTSGDVTTALGYTPVTQARTLTINGTTYDLSANRSWTVTTPETDTLQTVTNRGNVTTTSITANSVIIPSFETATNVLSFRSGIPDGTNVGIRAKAIATANRDGLELLGYNGIDFSIANGATVAARVVSNGNFLIGTTTDAGYKLDVNGTGRFATSLTVGAGGLAGRLSVRGTTNDSSAYSFEAANSSGNSLLLVRNDGIINASNLAGTGTRMVTANASGNLSTQTVPTGTVTSVSGTGGYGGLTLTGTVTSAGNITLGGTPTGIWPISSTGIYSPNGDTVVAADNAMPSTKDSFIHTLALGPGGNDGHILGMTWTNPSIYGAQIWMDTDPTRRMALRGRSSSGTWTSWTEVLTDSNYNSYSPTLTGTGASGTWPISITGTAGGVDWYSVSSKPSAWLNTPNLISDNVPNTAAPSGFYQDIAGSGNPTGTWMNYINVRHSNTSNVHGFQLGMSYYDNNLWFRSYQGGGSYQSWAMGLSTQNYNSYSPTLTGGNASGTWGISITGNSGTVNHNQNRTDGSAYAVLWGNNAGTTAAYSCAAVTIQSDVGMLSASRLYAGQYIFPATNFSPSAAPRSTTEPMSIKMWNNYFNGTGLGSDYGTVLEYNGMSGHVDSQVYFDAAGGSWYRSASYNSGWQGWQRYVTEGSTWNISITGNAANSTYAEYTRCYVSRTDGSSYGVVWNNGSNYSPNYICDDVRITSSTATLGAKSFVATPALNQLGLTVNHGGGTGAPAAKFNSAGGGTTYGANTVTIDGCNYGSGLKIVTNLWSASQQAVQFTGPTTTVGSITCTTSATSYNTSSDYRLKENVTPIEFSINRLKELNPCRFNFINDPHKTVDGFIAHEVQEIVPEAVTGEKDELDYDGSPKYQGIDQSKIVPLLTAALQEAIAKIELLEQRINILENK
jgi:hypothetical protein